MNQATERTTQSDAAALPLSDLLQKLHSAECGLSTSAAADILKRIGANRIDTGKRKSFLLAFVVRFTNPLVLILLFAAAVSAFTDDVPSFLIITVIVLMSVTLDVMQEHQAQRAADSLRKQVSLSTKVLRDGHPIDIPATEIVPGDMVLLVAGDLIPADARLVEARDLHVDEALLTGEAYPAEKEVTVSSAEITSASVFPKNLVFMGSSVVSGTAKALILPGVTLSLVRSPARCRRNRRQPRLPSEYRNLE